MSAPSAPLPTSLSSINPTVLARLFDQSKSSVVVLRARDFAVVDANQAFERYTGVTREAILGKRPQEFGLWQDEQQYRTVINQLRDANSVVSMAVSFHMADGQFGDGLLCIEPFEFAGSGYFLAFTQDVHSFANPQNALIRPLAGYASFFQDANQGFYRLWPNRAGLIAANPRFAEILGYPSVAALIEASQSGPLRHHAEREDFEALRTELRTQGYARERRVQMRRVDGALVWVTESARAIRGRDQEVLFVEGSITDMSAIDQIQVRAKEMQERYRLVVDNSLEGVYIIQNGKILFANPALERALGYSGEELYRLDYTKDLVDPRDQMMMHERIAMRARGVVPPSNYEVRVVRRDREVRLFAVRVDALELETGPAITGSMRDITDERESALRLRHAEDRYRKLFENAAVGMFQACADGEIQEANIALLHMFGYKNKAQLHGSNVNLLASFADPKQRDEVKGLIHAGESLQNYETRMIHRDGHEFWVSMSMRCVQREPAEYVDGVEPITIEGSMQDISARRLAELQLKFQANHDSLTRTPNRSRFEAILTEYLAPLRLLPAETERAHWVLLMDLDGFKVVNDSLGHAAGDDLLVMICDRLLKDLPNELVFSRYGGDEFAIVTRERTRSTSAILIAEAILQALAQPFLVRGQQIFASASIGMLCMDASYKDAQHVMRDVDTAMYRAKAMGKSRYVVFDGGMHRAAQARLKLETDLRFALERGEFETYFQPIVELRSGSIVGAESLIRWRHPVRGMLLPAEFLSVAEESGLLMGVDWYVVDQACRQFMVWQKELGSAAPESISVNISDRLFASRGFSSSLSDLIRRHGVAPTALHLEITETVFRGNYQETLDILRELNAIGVKLLVDDFGTGYSSLVSFTHASFDGLKIDRGFVEDIESNVRNRALVKTICQFARDLEIDVVCEGIERFSQAEILMEFGCKLGQGFRYAPALSSDSFIRRMLEHTGFPGHARPPLS